MWEAELYEVLKTLDVERFKAFYTKWKARGFYKMPLPTNDYVIELSMRKMLYHWDEATEEQKAAAEKWLIEHRSSTDLGLE